MFASMNSTARCSCRVERLPRYVRRRHSPGVAATQPREECERDAFGEQLAGRTAGVNLGADATAQPLEDRVASREQRARFDDADVVVDVRVNPFRVDLDGKHFAWRAVPPAVVHQEAGREDVDLPGGEEQLVDRFSRTDARPAVGADPDQQQGMRVVAMRDLGLAHVRVRLERQSGPVVDRQGGERLTVETDDAVAFEQRNVRSHRAQRPVMKRPASRRTISG
jgi:hypothetical protein